MHKLKNSKHEAFATLVAARTPATNAYHEVYGANPKSAGPCASRLLKNAKVAARVKELRNRQIEAIKKRVCFDAVKQFERLEATIRLAEQAGLFEAALKARIQILEMFGYKDNPTLTHEHVLGRKISIGTALSAHPDTNEVASARNDHIVQFQNALARARTLEER